MSQLSNQNSSYLDRTSNLYKAKQETIQTFIDQIFLEREIDNAKRGFLDVREFSIQAAIRLFDKKGRGSVSLSEFQEIAHDLLTPCTNPYLLNSQTY